MNAEHFEEQRREMVAAVRAITGHLAAKLGKTALDERVLRAMGKVPRHEFVPVEVQPYAYLNRPIPIGFDKTISQPLMVRRPPSPSWGRPEAQHRCVLISVSASGKRDFAGQRQRRRKGPSHSTDRQQRQSPRTKTQQFGAICTTPGNLRLYGTAWWAREDSNLQPSGYEPLALRCVRDIQQRMRL